MFVEPNNADDPIVIASHGKVCSMIVLCTLTYQATAKVMDIIAITREKDKMTPLPDNGSRQSGNITPYVATFCGACSRSYR